MSGSNTGGISFGITTALAAGALLILGGRLAIVLSSPAAKATTVVSNGPADLRTTPEIPQDSSTRPAVVRKAKGLRPTIAFSTVAERRADSVKGRPEADPIFTSPMPGTSCAVARKSDRKKGLGGFRMAVGKVAAKIFSVGRKKKVDMALREPAEKDYLYTVV